jgi:hypothetical protein
MWKGWYTTVELLRYDLWLLMKLTHILLLGIFFKHSMSLEKIAVNEL